MNLPTYSQIKQKIENDLDLIDEDFVSETELLGYMNEAIDDAETLIHTLGLESRYFLTMDTLTLVSGTSDYSMPSDIYANKLVKVQYINGSKKYDVVRIRDLSEIPNVQSGDDYRYIVFNFTAGVKKRIYPTPLESGAYINRYYIRNVRSLTSSTDASNTCELPECINFLYSHVKMRVAEKERIAENVQKAMADVKVQYELMAQTLQEMIPDGDNSIIPDMSFYEDMYFNFGGNY